MVREARELPERGHIAFNQADLNARRRFIARREMWKLEAHASTGKQVTGTVARFITSTSETHSRTRSRMITSLPAYQS